MDETSRRTGIDIASAPSSLRSLGIENGDDSENVDTESFSDTDHVNEDINDAISDELPYDILDQINEDTNDARSDEKHDDTRDQGGDGNAEKEASPPEYTAEELEAIADSWAEKKVKYPLRIRIWTWICAIFWSFVLYVRGPPDYATDNTSVRMKIARP